MTDDGFSARLEVHRRELLMFCYRMLGSLVDAEDAVQDTMLRAWRAADRYDEHRASVRTWLYRIATNVCLTAAGQRARRALPADLGPPSDDLRRPLVPATDVAWLQPLPDALVADERLAGDPAATAVRRDHLRLALVATMQRLPARQRAAVILREALDCSAAEIARFLDTTPAAVNSALQRARTALAAAGTDPALDADDVAGRRLVAAYAKAFEAADVAAIRELVTADVILEMPPIPFWFAGRDDYGRFMEGVFERRGIEWSTTSTAANGQPALVVHAPAADGPLVVHSYQVFDVAPEGIRRNTVFYDGTFIAHLGIEPHIEPNIEPNVSP